MESRPQREGEGPPSRVHPPSPNTAEHRRLYVLARAAVQRYYHKPLTLERIARAIASSPRQLQRAYARFGENTFRNDLARQRMEVGAELLRSTSLPVRDVARRVGYSNPSHFGRAFRRRYGISPSNHRARSRQATRTQTGALAA
jgi:AraC family transcriptional regulator of adaptative response / methylphosphotriester-DNA alkyltransferase methyltransferase